MHVFCKPWIGHASRLFVSVILPVTCDGLYPLPKGMSAPSSTDGKGDEVPSHNIDAAHMRKTALVDKVQVYSTPLTH